MSRSATFVVNGRRIETDCVPAERADSPTFVFLHEALGSVAHWKDFPDRLAAVTGAAVFVYSRQGHGASSPLEGPRSLTYMHDEAEAVLPELLRAAGVDRPIILGHSDGASIALLFASRYPDAIAGLILEAPHIVVEDLTVAGIAAATVAYRTTALRDRLARYHDKVDALFWAWSDIWLDPTFRRWNIESALDAIRCPVLIIQGADDEYGTLDQVERIRSRLPWAEVAIFSNCRHAPHRDQPELTLQRVKAFIDRHVMLKALI